jgi:hypothetical protein
MLKVFQKKGVSKVHEVRLYDVSLKSKITATANICFKDTLLSPHETQHIELSIELSVVSFEYLIRYELLNATKVPPQYFEKKLVGISCNL